MASAAFLECNVAAGNAMEPFAYDPDWVKGAVGLHAQPTLTASSPPPTKMTIAVLAAANIATMRKNLAYSTAVRSAQTTETASERELV